MRALNVTHAKAEPKGMPDSDSAGNSLFFRFSSRSALLGTFSIMQEPEGALLSDYDLGTQHQQKHVFVFKQN